MEKSIESFINQCDDLMITEEGFTTSEKFKGLAITAIMIAGVVLMVKDEIEKKRYPAVASSANIKLSASDKKQVIMSKQEVELHIKSLFKLCEENTENQILKLKSELNKKYHVMFMNGMDNEVGTNDFMLGFLHYPGHIDDKLPGYSNKIMSDDGDEGSPFAKTLDDFCKKYEHCLNFISSQCRTIISEYSRQLNIPAMTYDEKARKVVHTFDIGTGDGDEGSVYIEYKGKFSK